MLGLAPGTARAARPAVELAFRPAGLLPGSSASGAPRPRLPAAPLTGFPLDRVTGTYHVIVAPLAACVAAKHGLPDGWGGPGAWRRAVAAGPPPELEQVPVQAAHRATTP